MGNNYGAMKHNLTETDLNENDERQKNAMKFVHHSYTVDFSNHLIDKSAKLLHTQSTNYIRASRVAASIKSPKAKSSNSRSLSVDRPQTSNSTSVYKRKINLFATKISTLNKSMRIAITNCWQKILKQYYNDYSKVGLQIYTRIFDACPELRQAFYIPHEMQNVSDYNPFHRSGRLLASVIDLCIRNIYKLESEMGSVLIMYGRRHYHRQKQGFRLSYFPVFEQCALDFISDSTSDVEKTDDLMEGWHLMLSYIIEKMTEGVLLEWQAACTNRNGRGQL